MRTVSATLGWLVATFSLLVAACGGARPEITGLSPTQGPVGTVVTILGHNLGDDATKLKSVSFGGVEAKESDVEKWTQTEIVVAVPEGAKTGPVIVTVGLRMSNADKVFIVLPEALAGKGSRYFVVGSEQPPHIELFGTWHFTDRTHVMKLLDIAIEREGFSRLHSLGLAVRDEKVFKIYAGVSRMLGSDEISELLAYPRQSPTQPTVVDVGVDPAAMTLSPDSSVLFVASTASALLTVVSTEDDRPLPDRTMDLGAVSFGFQPLQVLRAASPNPAQWGGYLLFVVGNNWYRGHGEILTFAPDASRETDRWVSSLGVSDTWLSAAAASDATRIWVVGSRHGVASLGLVDPLAQRILDQKDLAAGGYELPLPEGVASLGEVTALVPVTETASLYLAAPQVGLYRLTMARESTAVAAPDVPAQLIALDTSPTSLHPLYNPEGQLEKLLVLRAGLRGVEAIVGSERTQYVETFTTPTILGVLPKPIAP